MNDDFVRVSDELRKQRPKHRGVEPNHPLADALVRGETVFVALNGRTRHQIVSSTGNAVKRRDGGNVRSFVHEHAGQTGIVLWAVKEKKQ